MVNVSTRLTTPIGGLALAVAVTLATGVPGVARAAPIDPTTAPRCNLPGATVAHKPPQRASSSTLPVTQAGSGSSQTFTVSVAQPYAAGGEPLLVFTIKIDDLSKLYAGATYSANFSTATGGAGYNVYMFVRSSTTPLTAATVGFYSEPGTNNGFGPGSNTTPAQPGSHYTPDGVITIYVRPRDVGLTTPGQGLHDVVGRSYAPFATYVDGYGFVGGGPEPVDTSYDRLRNDNPTFDPFPYLANAVCAPNRPPVASLAVDKTSGSRPLTVQLSGLGSSDPDTEVGDAVGGYAFTFGDGDTSPTSSASGRIGHTYTRSGTYAATLQVTDLRGAVSTNAARVTVTVADPAPAPAPASTAKVNAFGFAERTGVARGSFVTSETVTLAGSGSGTLGVSVAGGNAMQYSLNGAAFTAGAGTARLGDKLVVRHIAASTASTGVTTTVTVGTTTASFKSTTAK